MKRRLLACCLSLGMAVTAFAQGPGSPVDVRHRYSPPRPERFSWEMGAGLCPFHMMFRFDWNSYLEDQGQEVYGDGINPLALSISGIYRHDAHSEFVLTGGLSWVRYHYTQYGTFGIDPQGKPRYDLEVKEKEWTDTDYTPSLTLSYRYIWYPGDAVEWYSGASLGLVYRDKMSILPGITLVGFRAGRGAFYFFAEHSYSPVSTFIHGGLGLRF